MQQTPDADLLSRIPPAPKIEPRAAAEPEAVVFEAPIADERLMLKALLAPDTVTPDERASLDAYRLASEEAERRRDMLGIVDLATVMEAGDVEPEMLVDDLLVQNMHHIVYNQKQSKKT